MIWQGANNRYRNEDGSIWIVFNGEIYNYQELRNDLKTKSHIFKTNGDTEVIVHLYEEYGPQCVNHLRGMFAFAIWNQTTRNLLVVRDRLGIKPLYYYQDEKGFYFASEIKSILQCKRVESEIDQVGLKRYLKYRFVYGQKTMFKNVHELMPGNFIQVHDQKVQISQYWNISYSEKLNGKSLEDLSRMLMDELNDSVHHRMISDVPIGSFLSGGVDSSAITALMAQNSSEQVKTFSIGFIPEEENELKYAKIIADQFNSGHHEHFMSSENILRSI